MVAYLLHAWQISRQISQVCLSRGSIAESFHSLQSVSVSCLHVIRGLLGPHFPSTCMSKAVLTAPLECSTCPYQQSFLSFRMRSRSSKPSPTSSSLMVTMSFILTLQICLIIALSFYCRCWRFGFVSGQVSLAWSILLPTQEQYMRLHVLKKRWQEERTDSSSLNFFRWFSHMLWLKILSHQLLRACLLGSKMNLPPPACQV